MESTFKLQIAKDTLIKDYKHNAIRELNLFYEKDWEPNSIKLFILPDKNTLDSLKGKSTESWEVGFCFSINSIAIMARKAITDSGIHTYSDDFYYKLIKHEISHIYFEATYGKCSFSWINEGMAVCLAEQCSRIREFKGFLEGKNLYMEAGYLFRLLIDLFGKERLFEFLKAQSGVTDKNSISNSFEKIFGLKLEYKSLNTLLK